MTMHEPEVLTLESAEDLIQEIICLFNTEGIPDGFLPDGRWNAIYITEAKQ